MVKAIKNLLLHKQESFEPESRHWGFKVYQFYSNDDHRLTSDLLLQGQFYIPIHLYLENIQKSFLSLLATASRLYAIAWGFLLRHKRIFITAIFIRALLLNQTQCGTYYGELNVKQGNFFIAFLFR